MPDRRAPPTRLMMRKPKRASSQPELIRCIEDGIDRSGDNTTGLQASARSAPGHTIKITEQRATDSGFVARLSLDDGAQYPIMITNPLECAGEEDLDAYFQAYSKPFSDSRAPERGTCSVADYGKALFEQIFVHERARGEYEALRGRLADTAIEIVGDSPGFHALHWEALQDPDHQRPLAVDCVMMRRRRGQAPAPRRGRPSRSMNMLVVAARPSGEWGVGRQTAARHLVEAAWGVGSRVNVELLRPGSFKALSAELEAKGAGFYHLVHFDCPVSLLSYREACARGSLRRDRQDLAGREFGGLREFLVMEGEDRPELVEAGELAGLLVAKGIPICVLNACKLGRFRASRSVEGQASSPSPHQVGCKASLGSGLMGGGVQTVVAMSYSMAASATQILAQTLYKQLLAGQPVVKALQLGRQELYRRKGRGPFSNRKVGGFERRVDLEDWMLPVVYVNQPVSLKLLDFKGSREWEGGSEKPGANRRFAQPTYGFVGRDTEILEMENKLLWQNVLLLRGKSGTGKTALLMYLRDWWQMTKFAWKAIYFGYNGRPCTLQQILLEITRHLYCEPGQKRFQTMSEQEQADVLIAKLRNEPHALLFDDLESTPAGESTNKDAMAGDEKEKLCHFLSQLADGQTKMVLCFNECGSWLEGARELCESVYELQGLSPLSRSVLAEKILERHVVDDARMAQLRRDRDFNRLLAALGGYPLLMEIVLANLRQQSPAEILAGLETTSVDETSSVLSCVERAYRAMPVQKHELLTLLAPFEAFLAWDTLHMYTAELKRHKPFQAFDFAGFDDAVQDAIDLGLLSPISSDGDDGRRPGLTIEPVFTSFLKTIFSQQDAAMCGAVQEGFKKYYQWCAGVYLRMMKSQESERGLQLCELEYRNLYRALEVCLEDKDTAAISNCLHTYFELKGDSAGGLRLAHLVCEAQSNKIEMGAETAVAQEWLAKWYLKMKDFQAAKGVYQSVLAIYRCLEGDSKLQMQGLGSTYHQMGVVAQELGELSQARRNYKRALEIFAEFGDRHSQASTYHQLGLVAQVTRDFGEAKQLYQRALQIFVEFDDSQGQVNSHHQLAGMAQAQGDHRRAIQSYQLALEVCIASGDRHSQATTHYHLGSVAQELRDFNAARENFVKALDIFVALDDRHSQARAYHQLGKVSQELSEFEEARRTYEQALAIFVEFDDSSSQAHTYHQLGNIAERLRDFDEAYRHYQQALDVGAGGGDRLSQATTYHHLGIVAQQSRIFDEAIDNYERTIKILGELGDRRPQADAYHQLGVVAQELRKFDEARLNYLKALEIYIEFGDRHAQADTHHHLGLVAQELKGFDEARQKFQRALDMYIECDDRAGQASAYYNLGTVAKEMGRPSEARRNFNKALTIDAESKDRHSQASTYFALGALDEMQRNYLGARANVRRGLQILEEFHDQRVVAIATRWLNRMQMDAGNEAGMDGDMAAEANDRMGRDPIDDMEADASRAEDVRVSGKPIKRCQLWWKMAVKRFSRSWRPGKVGSNPQHDYSGRLTRVFTWQGVERRGANMSTKSELD